MRFLPGFIFKSLRIKFATVVALLLLCVFSISSGALIIRSINTQTNSLISQARAYAKLTAKPIGNTYSLYYDSGYLKFAELINQTLVLNSDIKKIQIISVTGEILFDSAQLIRNQKPEKQDKINDITILEKIKSNTSSEVSKSTSNSQPNQIIEPYFADFGAHPFSIRYFISYDSVNQNILSTVITTLLLSALFFATAILSIVWLVNRLILNPIGTVIQGTRKISLGDFSHTIQIETQDEVGDLALAVNQMAQTLRKNIRDLQELDNLKDEFVYLASHNLRTPLTVMKGYLELIQENTTLDNDTLDKIKKISAATKNLEDITETLLSLVSFEKGKETISRKPVDLAALLENIGSELGKKAVEKKISFVYELPNVPLDKIEMDEARIKQALTGLVDNAIKFNKIEGKVVIKIEKKVDEVVISVKDTGVGIEKTEKENVFKKFYRTTDTLTYNYTGIGLGLYLTKLIIEAHQGRIWFDSDFGKGSTFYVSLPLNKTKTSTV